MTRARGPIRVLVIDDSAYSRQLITRMLETSPLVEVVGVARDGEEALRKTFELEPELITLDLEMPRMDGFTFLRIVMARRPTPVLVVSGRSREEDVFKALELGAVDFVAKPGEPGEPASRELEAIEDALIRKVHAIRSLRIDRVSTGLGSLPSPAEGRPVHASLEADSGRLPIVVIGSSTGGPAALTRILTAFGSELSLPHCAFFVAQHMPSGFTEGFAERLDRLTPFDVREARAGERAQPGSVRIAPGGRHLELSSDREGGLAARISADASGARYTPSVDRLFASAAKHCGPDLLAVVLTGMGDDGRVGACQVKQAGGRVIAESEETAVIYGMPKQVVAAGAADQVLALTAIPGAIARGVDDVRAPDGCRASVRGRR